MTDAIFIRHSLDTDVLHRLWDERLIAIQYDNIASIDPDEYQQKTGRHALIRLLDSCKSGALVGATYRRIKPSQILVGRIEPGTLVEILYLGGHYNKVVRLVDARPISYRDYPLLSAIQPQQLTISRWKKAQDHLTAILDGKQLERRVESLHPSQLEVLCYEYLRVMGWLDVLILPIGRTLADVDIYGIRNSDQLVIAQVTQSTNKAKIEEKKSRLLEYKVDNAQLVFFARRSQRFADSAIQFISIEEVFEYLDSESAGIIYHNLISRMLNAQRL